MDLYIYIYIYIYVYIIYIYIYIYTYIHRKERSPPMGLDFRWGETFTEWNRDDAQQELDYRLEMNQISVRDSPPPRTARDMMPTTLVKETYYIIKITCHTSKRDLLCLA